MSEPEKTKVQVFIAMDENGNWTLGASKQEASGALKDYDGSMCRIAVLDVNMSPPRLTDGGEVDIPDEPTDLPEVSRASHQSG